MSIFRYQAAILTAATLGLSACGSGGSGVGGDSLSGVGLGDLPSASEMVGTSDSATSLSRALVSGEEFAPLVTELSDDPDQYFWNGLIAEINGDGYVYNDDDRDDYWAGRGLCWMAQGFTQSFSNVLQAGTSVCYMKNFPNASSGVTITGASNASNLFTPESSNKVVKVSISGDEMGEESVFIKTHGTSEVGSNKIKYSLWFCSPGGEAARGAEIIEVDLDTGAYSATNIQDDENSKGSSTLEGFLRQTADGLEWDTSRARSAFVHYLFSFEQDADNFHAGNFKAEITIDGDLLTTRMRESSNGEWSGNAYGNESSRYLAANFSGSNINDLKLLAIGSKEKMVSSGQWEGTWEPPTVAADWIATDATDGYYVPQGSGDLLDLADAADFTEDFYTSIAEPDTALDPSEYPCDISAATEVTLDMADPALMEVSSACEQRIENWEMCNAGDVQAAERVIFENQFNPGP